MALVVGLRRQTGRPAAAGEGPVIDMCATSIAAVQARLSRFSARSSDGLRIESRHGALWPSHAARRDTRSTGHRRAVLVSHDPRNLMKMREVVRSPRREQLRESNDYRAPDGVRGDQDRPAAGSVPAGLLRLSRPRRGRIRRAAPSAILPSTRTSPCRSNGSNARVSPILQHDPWRAASNRCVRRESDGRRCRRRSRCVRLHFVSSRRRADREAARRAPPACGPAGRRVSERAWCMMRLPSSCCPVIRDHLCRGQ